MYKGQWGSGKEQAVRVGGSLVWELVGPGTQKTLRSCSPREMVTMALVIPL